MTGGIPNGPVVEPGDDRAQPSPYRPAVGQELATAGTPPEALINDEAWTALVGNLDEARHLGFLGPGPVGDQVLRSLAFASALDGPFTGSAVDLGSGGGLPGLVLALAWPRSEWVLVDSNQRRCRWLSAFAGRMGLQDRCQVLCERAELVGRGRHRYQADLVTARSFGPPAPTAECAAPLLRVGGQLAVTDPPDVGPDRWPDVGLARLGLMATKSVPIPTGAGPVSLTILNSTSPCPENYPRRVGVPFKRPLF